VEYNEQHGIKPESVRKAIRDLLVAEVAEEPAIYGEGEPGREMADVVAELEYDMRLAAQELRFEEAAKIRDRIRSLHGAPAGPPKTHTKRTVRKRGKRR
jgi:excinuclease ABC subunit B